MTFTESIRTCLTKYADFKGCASRSEFWWFGLAIFLISLGLSTINQSLSGLFSLASIIPSVAVATRRLHDTDRSGWYQLLGIIPFIGWIVLIVFYAQDTKPGSRYATSLIDHTVV